jgi:alpha-amylase
MSISIRFLLIAFFVLSQLSTGAQTTSAWWRNAVFYEVFVRSYFDTNADGKGDLNGLISKLDYLNDGNPETNQDLGIDALWLMPIMPSPSYHGYDVTDYYDVESDYGNRQQFRNLIDGAHARGIRVIIDLVLNHSSSQHPWFVASKSSVSSPNRDWYVWSTTDPGFSGPWGQQVWHQSTNNWYYGIFWGGMPDLNYKTPAVQQEMKHVTRYWIDSMHVDGFRLDAIQYLVEDGNQLFGVPETFSYLQDWKSDFSNSNPDVMAVGEVWSQTPVVVPYIQPGLLDLCFEFELAGSIISSINAASPDNFQNQLETVLQSYPQGKYATFLTNHDMNRSNDQLGGSVLKNKLAASVYLTLPGTPFLYYGEEIGMAGTGIDEMKRKPMQWSSAAKAGFTTGNPWISVNSNYTEVNVADQQSYNGSLLATYKNLIQVRHEYAALAEGDCKLIVDTDSDLVGYIRYTPTDLLLVVHNFGDNTISNLDLSFPPSGISGGTYAVKDLLDSLSFVNNLLLTDQGACSNYLPGVALAPYQTRIFLVDRLVKIEELEARKSLKLYPNPVRSIVSIETPAKGTISGINIMNVLGQCEINKSDTSKTIDVSALSAGLYIMLIEFEDGTHISKKFIKE